jgi:hypothetical protein
VEDGRSAAGGNQRVDRKRSQSSAAALAGLLTAALPFIAGLLLAGAVRLWGVPLATGLPADMSSELELLSKTRFRASLTSSWEDILHIGRRTDRVVSLSDGAAIIQAGVDWSDEKGNQIYQTSGLYGVDRQTRGNVAGLGDRSRSGQFMLPPFFDRKSFAIWDPYYSGPREVAFLRQDQVAGVAVAVYHFVVRDLDETEAYSFMPEVPARYKVVTNGEGEMAVEPVSGLIVDFTDRGNDAFVDRASGQAAGAFLSWAASYSDATRAAQVERALAQRRLTLALRDWIPLGLAGMGLLGSLALLLRRRRPQAA